MRYYLFLFDTLPPLAWLCFFGLKIKKKTECSIIINALQDTSVHLNIWKTILKIVKIHVPKHDGMKSFAIVLVLLTWFDVIPVAFALSKGSQGYLQNRRVYITAGSAYLHVHIEISPITSRNVPVERQGDA